MPKKRLAVFASGQGSLLEAIIASKLPIELVVVDRPCKAAEIAINSNIEMVLIERTDFSKSFDRRAYSRKLLGVIKKYKINLIAMAGFMTILSPDFFEAYGGEIINSHPSLLPEFKGHNAVEQALGSGANKTGCTIHIATAEVDTGQIISQAEVPILKTDTEDILHERIKQQERLLYPKVLRSLMK